jgi:hypothetical protein
MAKADGANAKVEMSAKIEEERRSMMSLILFIENVSQLDACPLLRIVIKRNWKM